MKLWEKLEMEKTVTKNKDNEVLKNYYRTFGEFPFLLTTQTFDGIDYQVLMNNAINRNKPLEKEEIVSWFDGKYDLLQGNQVFSKFRKKSK